MESLGKYLRNERIARHISLGDISKFTKIKEVYLKAIEDERFDLLPPSFYVKGYLKNYAQYLGLDLKDVLLKYQNYLEALAPPPTSDLPKQMIPLKKGFRPWSLFPLVLGAWGVILIISLLRNDTIEEERKVIQQKESSPSISRAQSNTSILLPKEEKRSFNQEIHELSKDVQPMIAKALTRTEEELTSTEERKGLSLQCKNGLNGLEILEAGLGTGIERTGLQRFLTGKCTYFLSNHQRGYFFTKIRSKKPSQITHIWLWEGKEYHRIEMEVKPPLWSVYSYLTFRPYHVGNWRSEVREGDHVLVSLSFKVIPSNESQTELHSSLQSDSAESHNPL